MKTICFYFQIHQPFRLKQYRFFDIGADHYYYDDYNNERIIAEIAQRSFIPANQLLLEMIQEAKGAFKVAFSISGVALEQMEMYTPEVIDSFKALAKTGQVEFLSETYGHTIASLHDDPTVFFDQVKRHKQKIYELFGQHPTVFRNTELIYSDEIGDLIASMGYKAVITEGAKHVLGWKSPNYIYKSASNPNLKMLLKNFKLSDDISFRFSNYEWSEYPLTADKFISWIKNTPVQEQVFNLFMNYETFGQMQPRESGIFEFLRAIPRLAKEHSISFSTPSELAEKMKPVDTLSVPYPVSWADEARDVSAWLGNNLQREAFDKLFSVSERVLLSKDKRINQDWTYLQSSDHFYYMSTKHQSDGAVHSFFSPYDSPYSAFTNYMNVLADFIERVNQLFPEDVETEELNSLLLTIRNQAIEISDLKKQVRIFADEVQIAQQESKTAKIAAKPKAKTATTKSKATDTKK